jgi:hypothetical protein
LLAALLARSRDSATARLDTVVEHFEQLAQTTEAAQPAPISPRKGELGLEEEPQGSLPPEEPGVPADLVTLSSNKWIVGGVLALVLAWAAGVFVGSYILAGRESITRALPPGSAGMQYSFCCALPVLALSVWGLWSVARGFVAGKLNRSNVIGAIILGAIIASVGGCFAAILPVFALIIWYH